MATMSTSVDPASDYPTNSSTSVGDNEEVKEEITQEVIDRLQGLVNFGYGCFQLCMSMVPPKILRLIEFLGFEGDRELGLACLESTSHSRDMKAPLATLALLWYHTVLRPFFALDGANKGLASTIEAETIIAQKEGDFPNSSLFLFFRGRILRLQKEMGKALELYQRALEEAKGQREVELMCLYEISWCNLLQCNWVASQDGFARLQKESKWSQAYYTYLVAVCLGARGECDGARDMFTKVAGLVRKKNNQIEVFVMRRAEKMKKGKVSIEHCRLLTLEMVFLWHALPNCTDKELRAFVDVCDMQIDPNLMALKCMCEGAVYKELGDLEMSGTCLREALARHQGKKEDLYIPAFTLFELASICMRSPDTLEEAGTHLQTIKDNYKDFDFDNRLSVRVNNALRRVKVGLS